MFDMGNSETFWLNVTNGVLGLVTLVCLIAFGKVLLSEVVEKVRGRIPVKEDDHAFALPHLGITMADGGERHKSEDADKNSASQKN